MERITPEMKLDHLKKMVKLGLVDQFLYKYRPCSEYTENIFTGHSLWFEHPNNFNDPFDCWANIQDWDVKDLEKFIKEHVGTHAELSKECLSIGTDEIKKDIDDTLNEIGVCCFSRTEKSILMWSHYATYHQGICLKFDIFEDPTFFDGILPVEYVDAMPAYNHFKDSDRKKLINKIIQPKSKREWEYEQEVRVVKSQSAIELNGCQAFRFNPASLKKVIFGCKASETTITKFKELCKNNGLSHVSFAQMHQMRNGKFELEERAL